MKYLILLLSSLFISNIYSQTGAIEIAKDTTGIIQIVSEAMLRDASNGMYSEMLPKITTAYYQAPSTYNYSSPDNGGGGTSTKEMVTYLWINVNYMSYPVEMYNIDYAIVKAPDGTSDYAITNAVDKPRIRIGFVSKSENVYKCESSNCGTEVGNEARKYNVSAVNCGTFYVN